MPAFTLYGFRGSANTDRVRFALAEGGFTDYELVLLDPRKGEHKSKAHLDRHPWGKVPVAVFPDGFTLYESRAICKYLTKKYSFPLLPPASDLEAQALFDQAEGVESSYFAEPASKISFEKIGKKFSGLPPDEAVILAALKSLDAYFDVAERLLQKNEYMSGKEYTLVDVYYISLIQRLFLLGYGDIVVRREAVNAWWNRVVNRPAIQKLLTADKEAMAAAGKQ